MTPDSNRSPDELLEQAWAIRHLLDDTAPDDHAARIRLTAARDVVHHEAARAWRARGWRPITEAPVPASPTRSLLVAPAAAAAVGAWVSVTWLGGSSGLLALLVLVATTPLLAEMTGQAHRRIRGLALAAAGLLTVSVVTGAMPATLVLVPAASLLLAIGLVGTSPPRPLEVPDHP